MPIGVVLFVESVRVALAVPLGFRVMRPRLKVGIGRPGTGEEKQDTHADKSTAPENAERLVRTIVDVVESPGAIVSVAGIAEVLKSRAVVATKT